MKIIALPLVFLLLPGIALGQIPYSIGAQNVYSAVEYRKSLRLGRSALPPVAQKPQSRIIQPDSYFYEVHAIIQSSPGCNPAKVIIEDRVNGDEYTSGAFSPQLNIMRIRTGMSRTKLRKVVVHECGHAFDAARPNLSREIWSIFGYEPFVSNYPFMEATFASYQGAHYTDVLVAEDFAESYEAYVHGYLPRGDKFDFFDRYL